MSTTNCFPSPSRPHDDAAEPAEERMRIYSKLLSCGTTTTITTRTRDTTPGREAAVIVVGGGRTQNDNDRIIRTRKRS